MFEIKGKLLVWPLFFLFSPIFSYYFLPSFRQSSPFWVTQILFPCISLTQIIIYMSKQLQKVEISQPESPRFGNSGKPSVPSKAGLYGAPQQAFIKESEKNALNQNKLISPQELSKHKTKQSAWISLKGVVYDVTGYMKHHPGGDQLLDGCGRQSQDLFGIFVLKQMPIILGLMQNTSFEIVCQGTQNIDDQCLKVKKLIMKVIFAIGNPGTQYASTRHNAGIIFIQWLLNNKVKAKSINKSTKYTQFTLANDKIICISHTFMNLSGRAVQSFKSKNSGMSVSDLIVVHDDLEHKLGNMRIKQGGSPQGHNGIISISGSLKTKQFKRLQIGIDRPSSRDPQIVAKYVLSAMTKSEMESMKASFSKGVDLLKKHQFL